MSYTLTNPIFTAKTNELAECPDEEYDNTWLEVIDFLERNNKGDTEGVVKRITKME